MHEHAGDYRTARDWFVEAIGYCETRALPSAARFCLACLAVLHWRTGPWDQVITLCRQVLESADPSPAARDIATAMLGLTSGMQGHTRRARPFLLNALADARRRQALPVELMSGWGLALIDDLDGRPEAAAEGWRSLVRRWEQTQDGYYIITPARWAVTFFARLGKGVDARACTSVLARAAMTGHNEALAALGHALGETALLDGEPHQAVDHFLRALRHLEGLGLPYEEAETRWRAGVALGAAGEDRAAIDQLGQAYRMAHRLGAGPLAGVITQELKILGEPLERSLGRRAAARAQYSGLSGREMEVLQLISAGRSRREIGRMLFLSPRTVDMHVQSILNKLDCHSRTQAVLRARELGLLE